MEMSTRGVYETGDVKCGCLTKACVVGSVETWSEILLYLFALKCSSLSLISVFGCLPLFVSELYGVIFSLSLDVFGLVLYAKRFLLPLFRRDRTLSLLGL